MKTYYGEETKRALTNFPKNYHSVHLELIHALAKVKKAAARANCEDKGISEEIARSIESACDAILSGSLDNQFVTCALQGGAGTSINMNVNEVISTYAEELLNQKVQVHPLDAVNKSQSTNDVNPTALKIAAIELTQKLLTNIGHLLNTFKQQSQKYQTVPKLGRTHLQDAVPTTFGAVLTAYTEIIERNLKHIHEALSYYYELNLGGTAIGNSINASPTYQKAVYQELVKITNLPLKPGKNLMSQTSSTTDFLALSNAVLLYMTDLSKIANDLRLMTSGPQGGLGEITLLEMQKGSTIMPGKVNPVIPEMVNQTYFLISGLNVTINHATQAAQFELDVMFPILADTLITSLKLVSEVTDLFSEKCVATFIVNEERSKELLEKSTAYATLLTPKLGYDLVAQVVKESLKMRRTIRELILEKKLLTEEEFDTMVKI